jgi:hypothetical protein
MADSNRRHWVAGVRQRTSVSQSPKPGCERLLVTEEEDVDQRRLRGDYPQSFVHALLLEPARRLAGPGS